MPWQQSGVKAGRTWVIAPDVDTLKRRWRKLCNADKDKRVKLFKNSPTGCKIHQSKVQLPPYRRKLKPISELSKKAPLPDIMRYAYRSFDRQHIFADARLIDRPGPLLWATHGDHQVYVTSLLTEVLGKGPALTACADIPDLHHFSGRGAKDVIPLYRDAAGQEPNVLPGLLDLLGETYGCEVSPEDFLAYVYGVLAQPAFTERFYEELETRELRVPLTKDPKLFERAAKIGRYLLWLHTYGQRFTGRGRPKGRIPRGKARCTKPVSERPKDYPDHFEYDPESKRLIVGTGVFEPVKPEVYEFEVSGLKVVQSWLGYRMKSGQGKKSSPLDDIRPKHWTAQFTTELLELLWVLEKTIATYPRQEQRNFEQPSIYWRRVAVRGG